ncbi:MAG: ribonuclease HII [Oscillospiraceae bacterium]|nr:ribonuclease HII [Oscillospiraceae bacterium]
MSLLYEFDKGYKGIVCGIDEAGRGTLAGDVFAAAVVLNRVRHNPITQIAGLNDSKKLTANKREQLFDEIISNCGAYAIATASVEEIEELNILNATMLAMERAFEKLKTILDEQIASCGTESLTVLVDGNRAPNIPESITVVKGDTKSASIAAASILAKVARDRYATELDVMYPEYGFAKHKGYGTKLHREMLLKHGVSVIHRKSFLSKILYSRLS